MEKESSLGQMVAAIVVFSIKIKFMVLVTTSGRMEENLKVNGQMAKWMDKDYLCGLMERYMKVVTLMIKKKVMVCFNGQIMKKNIKEIGKMMNLME